MVCFLVGTESRTTLSFSTLVFVFFCSFFFFLFFFFFTCVHSSILSGSHVETFQVSSYRCELNKKKKRKEKKKEGEKDVEWKNVRDLRLFYKDTRSRRRPRLILVPKSTSVDSQLSARVTHWSEICTNTQASRIPNVVLKQWKDIKLWWILKGLRQE